MLYKSKTLLALVALVYGTGELKAPKTVHDLLAETRAGLVGGMGAHETTSPPTDADVFGRTTAAAAAGDTSIATRAAAFGPVASRHGLSGAPASARPGEDPRLRVTGRGPAASAWEELTQREAKLAEINHEAFRRERQLREAEERRMRERDEELDELEGWGLVRQAIQVEEPRYRDDDDLVVTDAYGAPPVTTRGPGGLGDFGAGGGKGVVPPSPTDSGSSTPTTAWSGQRTTPTTPEGTSFGGSLPGEPVGLGDGRFHRGQKVDTPTGTATVVAEHEFDPITGKPTKLYVQYSDGTKTRGFVATGAAAPLRAFDRSTYRPAVDTGTGRLAREVTGGPAAPAPRRARART